MGDCILTTTFSTDWLFKSIWPVDFDVTFWFRICKFYFIIEHTTPHMSILNHLFIVVQIILIIYILEKRKKIFFQWVLFLYVIGRLFLDWSAHFFKWENCLLSPFCFKHVHTLFSKICLAGLRRAWLLLVECSMKIYLFFLQVKLKLMYFSIFSVFLTTIICAVSLSTIAQCFIIPSWFQ